MIALYVYLVLKFWNKKEIISKLHVHWKYFKQNRWLSNIIVYFSEIIIIILFASELMFSHPNFRLNNKRNILKVERSTFNVQSYEFTFIWTSKFAFTMIIIIDYRRIKTTNERKVNIKMHHNLIFPSKTSFRIKINELLKILPTKSRKINFN